MTNSCGNIWTKVKESKLITIIIIAIVVIMVRNYIRKSARKAWTDEDLRKALKSTKRMSMRAAAQKYGIPHGTLHRYYRDNTLTKKPSGTVPIFNGPHEEQLIRYIDKLNDIFFGISQRDLRRLAYDLAERFQLKHTFKPDSAGEDWAFKFLARNRDVRIRSLKGPRVVDERQVPKLFRRLSHLLDVHRIDVNDIYNVDEFGVVYFVSSTEERLNPQPPRLDPMFTGRLQLDVIFKVDEDYGGIGQLVTAICCFNATGSFLPPTFVLPCEQLDVIGDRLMSSVDVAPPGSLALFSDDGWTSREVFVDWLSFFVKHVRPSKDHKVLLLMDNDESHVSASALDYATQNGIVMLSVPTHSADTLLPLHQGLFPPLSCRFNELSKNLEPPKCSHSTAAATSTSSSSSSREMEVVKIFGRALLDCCTMRCAVDGFRKSGINPRRAQDDAAQDRHDDDGCDYFEAIDSDDEVHLIEAIYRNGEVPPPPPQPEEQSNGEPTKSKSKKKKAKLKAKLKPKSKEKEQKQKLKQKLDGKLDRRRKVKHKSRRQKTVVAASSTSTMTSPDLIASGLLRRSRKSLPRKCRKSAFGVDEIENFVDDAAFLQ